jgi:flagellar biosynthesis/type III secretory pathway protein FliH
MTLLRPLLVLLVAACPAGQGIAQEPHLSEAVSRNIYARSAFAHGYRHGYEEGYHLGNVDINMARLPRTKKSQFRGLSVGYSPEFGLRRSFEAGFQAGLKAGYGDGYDGRPFRAVEAARSMAVALEEALSAAGGASYFDQGVGAGYRDGLVQGEASLPDAAASDFHLIGCANFHPDKPEQLPALASFCDGYQRGFVLGHGDALAPGAARPLEASK